MTHINPGTDTTINPIVIDDSFRSKPTTPSILAWAIKATEYQHIQNIPLWIPIFYGILAGVNIGIISLKSWSWAVNFLGCIILWCMGLYVMHDGYYRCVRVRVEEIEE
jgi:hypothetical protein